MCVRCGVNIQHYMHNCKTCSVDTHLHNPLTSLQLLSRSTYLFYSYNQQIHPNLTKTLPLPHTLTHLNTVYIFTFLRERLRLDVRLVSVITRFAPHACIRLLILVVK